MITLLRNAAVKGGEILRSYFRKNLVPSYKTTHHNLITEADIKSQKVIQEYLEKALVKHMHIQANEIGFIGEENLFKPGKYLFAIDPLDGTSNFATGFEYFGVSIGLFIDGRLRYGVIYEPLQDKLYYAERNKGAYRKDKNGIQKITMLQHNFKSTYFSGGISMHADIRRKQLALYDRLYPHFRGFISVYAGTSTMILLLENILGLCFAAGPGIWDISGGQVIIEEAGGIVADWNGKKLIYDLSDPEKRYPYMACHPKNLPLIFELMKGS